MNVCILDPILDVFKGGNHLSLFAACKDTQFTIVTNRTNPKSPDLPSNTKVITLNKRSGPFYYGFAHFLYAHYLLKKYPVSSKFWKQFDLIHLNQTLSPQLKKLNKTGVPVLYSIHHPVSVDRMIAIKESTFLEGLRWRARYALLRKWQKMLCRKMPNIMTVSNSSSNQIKKDYKCKNKNINVVYNGVDGDIFTLGNKETNYDVIALGSFIHPRKGFKYLEKIYKELSSKGYCIADVGRRSNEQQNILNSIPNVTTFGTIDQDKLIGLMQDSSCLVLTALYEGFGLSIIEALSAGRPAFAFDVGAIREVLEPIDDSIISPPRDIDSIVSKIESYLSLSESDRMEKGNEYRKKVLDLYSIDKSGKSLEALYKKIV